MFSSRLVNRRVDGSLSIYELDSILPVRNPIHVYAAILRFCAVCLSSRERARDRARPVTPKADLPGSNI